MRFGDKEGRHLTDYCQALNSFHIPHHKGEIITVSLLPKKHQHSRPQYFLFFSLSLFILEKKKEKKKPRGDAGLKSLEIFAKEKKKKKCKMQKCCSETLEMLRRNKPRKALCVGGRDTLILHTLTDAPEEEKSNHTVLTASAPN